MEDTCCDTLLVLSVRGCRFLPAPLGYAVAAEATFAGQPLQTDPVPLSSHVDFNSELVWQLPRHSLLWHRRQRTCVKIRLLACRRPTAADQQQFSQLMGYVVVSVRDARDHAALQWRTLLGCRKKCPLEVPAVQLALSTEARQLDSSERSDHALRASHVPAVSDKVSEASAVSVAGDGDDFLSAFGHEDRSVGVGRVVKEDNDVFQLGPAEGKQELFICCLNVSEITHADRLIPDSLKSFCNSLSKFHFFSNFLGYDIKSNPVSVSRLNSFSPQKLVFRVRCERDIFQTYFDDMKTIGVHVCLGELSVGSVSIPFDGLSLDDQALSAGLCAFNGKLSISQSSVSSNIRAEIVPQLHISFTVQAHTDEQYPRSVIDSATQMANSKLPESAGGDERRTPRDNDSVSRIMSPPSVNDNTALSSASSSSASTGDVVCRHYRFVLDIRSVSLDDARFAGRSVTLRFSYPYFGSACDRSIGPLSVERGTCQLDLDVTYEYNFAAPFDWLQLTLRRFPLVVQLEEATCDEVLGAARLDLSSVIGEESLSVADMHCVSSQITSVASEDCDGVIGRLEAYLSLRDMGKSDVEWSCANSQTPTAATATRVRENAVTTMISSSSSTSSSAATPRQLQLWMERQQQLFAEQLLAKETAHLRALSDEWKRCDSGRELQFQQRLRSVAELQRKLTRGLDLLDERGRLLDTEMARLNALQTDVRRACDRMSVQAEQVRGNVENKMSCCVARAETSVQRLSSLLGRVQQQLTESRARDSGRVVELSRQLDTTTKAKMYYKYRWAEAACQLQELRLAERSSGVSKCECQCSTADNNTAAKNVKIPSSEGMVSTMSGRRVLAELQDDPTSTTIVHDVDAQRTSPGDRNAECSVTAKSGGARSRKRVPDENQNEAVPCLSPLSHSSGYYPSVSSLSRAGTSPGACRSAGRPSTSCQSDTAKYIDNDISTDHGRSSVVDGFSSRQERISELREEREALLQTGLYSHDDHVIKLLESVIERLSLS